MNFFASIWAMLRNVFAAITAVFFYNSGKRDQKQATLEAENEALKAEIDRLGSKPVTDTDRMRFFARAIIKAKAREKAE